MTSIPPVSQMMPESPVYTLQTNLSFQHHGDVCKRCCRARVAESDDHWMRELSKTTAKTVVESSFFCENQDERQVTEGVVSVAKP